MIYKLNRKIFLPVSIEEAWKFFSSPQNLGKITPPEMKFRILFSSTDDRVEKGSIILYSVRPLLGLPVKWETEILVYRDKSCFVDVQRKGPYKLWHHLHSFKTEKGGVEMTDELWYKLPFGFLGRFAHWLFVKKKVEAIFEFRNKVIKELFIKKMEQ